MTRIEFYFNVSDKFAKTVEICEKAITKGRQLTIFTQDEAMSHDIQNLLWGQCATSFLANSQATDSISQFSPIVIDALGENLLQDDVLINMQNTQPIFFSRFRFLVELVGNDELDKAAARARFRFYKDRGYEIKSTNAAEIELEA